MQIKGKCHCGNIQFRLEWPGELSNIPARACSCSFCRRHGNVWTSSPDAALIATVANRDLVSRYSFETATASFFVCMTCGVVPLATSKIAGHLFAVVNTNVFEGLPDSALRYSPSAFGGEDLKVRLARRKENWISNVRITSSPAEILALTATTSTTSA
jgi:hypothetical protein